MQPYPAVLSTGGATDRNAPTAAVRSYVRRHGRITEGQQRALDTLWPEFGIESASPLDLAMTFGRSAKQVLEVGFGNGESLAAMAAASPDTDFIGVEVHRPGIGHLMIRARKLGLTNLRIICADAVEALDQMIPDRSLDRVQVFFPDPWPKKRHHKRRLVQTGFVRLVARRLRPRGLLHLATDWEDYAHHMMAVVSACDEFSNAAGPGQFSGRPPYRPETRFERRGQQLGHGVWDLLFGRR